MPGLVSRIEDARNVLIDTVGMGGRRADAVAGAVRWLDEALEEARELRETLLVGEPHMCVCEQPAVVDAAGVVCPTCAALRNCDCVEGDAPLRVAHPERAALAVRSSGGCSAEPFDDRCRFEEALRVMLRSRYRE